MNDEFIVNVPLKRFKQMEACEKLAEQLQSNAFDFPHIKVPSWQSGGTTWRNYVTKLKSEIERIAWNAYNYQD